MKLCELSFYDFSWIHMPFKQKKAFPCQGKLLKNSHYSFIKCQTYERKTFYSEFQY
jgi:hypothetical protein